MTAPIKPNEPIKAAEVCDEEATMLEFKMRFGGSLYFHGNDWHRTPEDALARAEEMRKAKLLSLKNQIQKLEAMTFVAPKA